MNKHTLHLKVIRLIDDDFLSNVLINKHPLMQDDEAINSAINAHAHIGERTLLVSDTVITSLENGDFKPLAKRFQEFMTVPPSNKPPIISYGQFGKRIKVIKMRGKRLYKIDRKLPPLVNFHILEVTYG